MALDTESFDILLATVQRFVRERLVRQKTTWRNTTRFLPPSSTR